MALTLKINGTDRSSWVKWPTVHITQVLTKEVDRAEFEIIKTPSKTIPDVNDEVTIIEDASTKVFGGVIVERQEKIEGGLLVGYLFRCKDFSQYLDRKLVVKTYNNMMAHEILQDVISTYTTGFTTTNVPSVSPTIQTLKFNYQQVTRCLTQLCDLIGWDWYVDYDKDIHLFQSESSLAPFGLTDTNDNFEWKSLELNRTLLQLKNSVYVRGGSYSKDFDASETPDSYIGDGTRQTFQLAYQWSSITVTLNGASKTVGIDQQTDPNTVDVIFNFKEKWIKFATAPTAGQAVKIFGTALIPILGNARDQLSIVTYGLYEGVVVDDNITSIDEAQTRAVAELRKFAATVNEGTFNTYQTGLRVGMTINVTSVIRGISKDFKINRLTAKARTPTALEYTVSLIASGQVTFTDIMVDLLQQGQQAIDVDPNEVLQRLEFLEEAFTVSEAVPTTSHTSGPYKWGPDAAAGVWNFFTWG